MAPSLPDLPAELLLKIVKHDLWWLEKQTYKCLRATCRELSLKLAYFFRLSFLRISRFTLGKPVSLD